MSEHVVCDLCHNLFSFLKHSLSQVKHVVDSTLLFMGTFKLWLRRTVVQAGTGMST